MGWLSLLPTSGGCSLWVAALRDESPVRASPRYKVSPMGEENASICYHFIEMLLAPVDEGSDGGHQ